MNSLGARSASRAAHHGLSIQRFRTPTPATHHRRDWALSRGFRRAFAGLLPPESLPKAGLLTLTFQFGFFGGFSVPTILWESPARLWQILTANFNHL